MARHSAATAPRRFVTSLPVTRLSTSRALDDHLATVLAVLRVGSRLLSGELVVSLASALDAWRLEPRKVLLTCRCLPASGSRPARARSSHTPGDRSRRVPARAEAHPSGAQ